MDSRIEEIIQRLDRARAGLAATIAPLSEPARQQRPAPDRWSVAEVLEHLILVERRVHALLQDVQLRAAADAVDGEAARPHRVSDEEVLDRTRRVETRAAFIAAQPRDTAAVWQEMVQVRHALRAFLVTADPDRLAGCEQPHAFLGTLNGLQWADFVAGHEARHTAQILENAALLLVQADA